MVRGFSSAFGSAASRGSGSSAGEQEVDPRRSGGTDTGGSDVPSLEEVNRRRAVTGLPPLSEQAYEEEFLDEESFSDEFFWQETVFDQIEDDIDSIADKYDLDLNYLQGWFNGQKDNLAGHLEKYMNQPMEIGAPTTGAASRQVPVNADPSTPQGMQNLILQARNWIGTRWPAFQEGLTAEIPSGSSGRRGRSGRGRGRPTEAEIRAQFDMTQLTNAVNQMSRALLLEESDDAKAVAEAYVGAIVQNPDQKLDFETFAREKILSKPRAKLIYANKPEGMSEEQFLQPFFQAAQQRIGPGFGSQAADIAIEGARFGASPQAFQARLNRTRQVQSSAPFLRNLGEKISSVRRVLK